MSAAGLAFITFLVLQNAGCDKPGAQAAGTPSAPEVTVETAERREVPILMDLAARVEAIATVDIFANVEGRLIETSFREGSVMKKGQMLFRIDPRRYQAAVQSAEAAVEKAEAELEMSREQQHLINAQAALRQAEADYLRANQDAERLKPLAASRAVPQRDLDTAIAAQSSAAAAVEAARATVRTTTVGDRIGVRQAQASLAAAQAALDQAKLDLEQTAVSAPINGLIGRLEVSVGNYVGRGAPRLLATISQVDPINVSFSIPETLYLHTTKEHHVDHEALDHIELILADNSKYPFQGKYTTLGRAIDEKSGTLAMEAQFPNPRDILLPGMTGHVRLAVETRADAVLVSERAVFDANGSKAVYVVAEGKATLRSVVVGGSYQGKIIIGKGLSNGEAVIVEGIKNVQPGETVIARTAH